MVSDDAARDASGAGIKVISRAVELLRVLHDVPEGLGLSALATRAGMPRSTVHRLLAALEVEGLVIAGPGGRSVLGPELRRLAGAAGGGIEQRLRPVLDGLFDELQETVDLAVLEGDHLRFVEQLAAPHRLRAVSALGARFPLHCTANGKALLALLGDDEVRALLPARLERFTPATVTSRKLLLEELQRVREGELAHDREEHTIGISAVGFAVGDPSGLHGAVTVPMPTSRYAGREARVGQLLTRARERAAAALAE